MWYEDKGVQILLGKTLTEVRQIDNDEILFTTDTGEEYKMYHNQDCCESVYIEDVVGDLQDLVGSPITVAEENTNSDNPQRFYYNDADKGSDNPDTYSEDESHTWTFYKLATIKGYVDIRWYGSSNGYYSESVSVVWINEPGKEEEH